MSPRMTAQLACDALQMALWRRKRPPERYRSHGPWRPVLFSRLSGATEAA
ncbi:putative transposase for IS3 [Escherichia coli DEC10A]|nr:putative transposase for IS3 [Escherichia coli DEC10A]